jgi:hypothetical protein
MIRVLVMIAITGFLVSVVTLSVAVGIGGPEAITRGAWAWGPHNHWAFSEDWNDRHWGWDDDDRHSGPQASRELTWSGGDTLDIAAPADVRYTQADGPAKVTVSGPRRLVDAVELRNGRLELTNNSGWRRHGGGLTVVISAPGVKRFSLEGSGKLDIDGYRQDSLKLDLSGDSDVTVKGDAKTLDLKISGSADADLGDLKLQSADVDISGSGDATLAPTEAANLRISGAGDVTLLTRPKKLESDVSGSGSVHQAERSMPDTPAASTTAAPASKRGRT